MKSGIKVCNEQFCQTFETFSSEKGLFFSFPLSPDLQDADHLLISTTKVAVKIYTMNNKVGTDQAVGPTAWHADTGRERLQQGCDVIMCSGRPHLRLRLGAVAVGPVLVGLVGAAAGINPAGLVTLAALEAVFQWGASTGVTVLPVCVTTMGGGGGELRVTVLFTFVSQCRAAVRIARPVALEKGETKSNDRG